MFQKSEIAIWGFKWYDQGGTPNLRYIWIRCVFIHISAGTSKTTCAKSDCVDTLLQKKEYTKTPTERERWGESVIFTTIGPWSSHLRQT